MVKQGEVHTMGREPGGIDWRVPGHTGRRIGENTRVAIVAGNERRTVSEGKRRAEKAKGPSRVPLVAGLLLGAVVGVVVWFYLVGAAIDFGRVARDGKTIAWVFTAAATVGAAVCLLLVFVLVARALVALGLISDYRPRRSSGRRAR